MFSQCSHFQMILYLWTDFYRVFSDTLWAVYALLRLWRGKVYDPKSHWNHIVISWFGTCITCTNTLSDWDLWLCQQWRCLLLFAFRKELNAQILHAVLKIACSIYRKRSVSSYLNTSYSFLSAFGCFLKSNIAALVQILYPIGQNQESFGKVKLSLVWKSQLSGLKDLKSLVGFSSLLVLMFHIKTKKGGGCFLAMCRWCN